MEIFEKKYKEVLDNANVIHKAGNKDIKQIMEQLFPELKESEDERIRKELLEHCKNQAKPYIQTGNKCPQIQSWIAWLEKNDEKTKGWSEEDKGNLLDVKCVIDEVWHDGKSTMCSKEELKDLWEWLDIIWQKVEYPQSTQEWTQEDEAFRNLIIDIIRVGHPGGLFTINESDVDIFLSNTVSDKRVINWLKSLGSRDNAYDKGYRDGFSAAKFNAWKPNKKQMKALKWAIDSCAVNSWMYKGFESLYNDIDKLRKD